jgi:hypothetical protein
MLRCPNCGNELKLLNEYIDTKNLLRFQDGTFKIVEAKDNYKLACMICGNPLPNEYLEEIASFLPRDS